MSNTVAGAKPKKEKKVKEPKAPKTPKVRQTFSMPNIPNVPAWAFNASCVLLIVWILGGAYLFINHVIPVAVYFVVFAVMVVICKFTDQE